MGFLILCKS